MSLTREQLFARARQMVAQCPHPTTLAEQLRILASRPRARKRAQPQPPQQKPVRAWWQDFDL